jgi:hypothetical protein
MAVPAHFCMDCRAADDILLVIFVTCFIAIQLYPVQVHRIIFTPADYIHHTNETMRLLIAEGSPILSERRTRIFSDLGNLSLVAFVGNPAEEQKSALEEKPGIIAIHFGFPDPDNLRMIFRFDELNSTTGNNSAYRNFRTPVHKKNQTCRGQVRISQKKDDPSTFILHLNKMDKAVKQIKLT